MPEMKLVKLLSERRIASRRTAKKMIQEGRVKVDGRTVDEPALLVDPEKATVQIGGRKIPPRLPRITLLLNKPRGTITSLKDPEGRRTVYDLLPRKIRKAGVYPVGRLDYQSEGLLFLTNDGDLANFLLSAEVEKKYRVKVLGIPEERKVQVLRRGITLPSGIRTRPCKIHLLTRTRSNAWYEVSLREGKKNQIRQMFKMMGHPVLRLKRTAIGHFRVRGIPAGTLRWVEKEDIDRLLSK